MVTTAASRHYTPLALRSFFARTPLGVDDRVILIDNDGGFELPADLAAATLEVVTPPAPRGFAANGNFLLQEARVRGADLFFLNNDLVFTTGWLDPLRVDRHALLSPLSNGQVGARTATFATQPWMDLEDYLGHEATVEAIAARLRASAGGYQLTPSVAFFCIKIPRRVYEVVGDFDEGFGRGGGEDRDYAVRAWLAGIPQEFAQESFVLHFQGKSTWRGAETPEQQAARDAQYTQAFQRKWGDALAYAFLRGDWNLLRSDAAIARMVQAGDYAGAVRRLRWRPSLEPFIKWQQNAKFAAVCCIDDDDASLPAVLDPVYAACDSVWLLVNRGPSQGQSTDRDDLIDRLGRLVDPGRKITIVQGNWADQAAQRNAGIEMAAAVGATYGFMLDADELHDAAQLRQAMTHARQNPQVDCWRVDAPESGEAVVFVRVGTGRFIENRSYDAPVQMTFPPDALGFRRMRRDGDLRAAS
jgi:GT2 family glycosyltransferase